MFADTKTQEDVCAGSVSEIFAKYVISFFNVPLAAPVVRRSRFLFPLNSGRLEIDRILIKR
jgi:hypothetical protein